MIKNALFDWSGVINDNPRLVHATVLEFFKAYKIEPIGYEQFRNELTLQYMKFYNKYFPSMTREEAVEMYDSAYRKVTEANPPKAYPGMVDLIKNLKGAGLNLLVVSADVPKHLTRELKEYGLENIFSEVNSDVHDKVTALPNILKRNNLIPTETIFIGDTGHEIIAGKGMGTLTGGVTWGIGTEEYLISTEPDYIFRTPEDIAEILLTNV